MNSALQFTRRSMRDMAIVGSVLAVGHYVAINTLNADQMLGFYSTAEVVGWGAGKFLAVMFMLLGAAGFAGVASYLQNGRRKWPSLVPYALGSVCFTAAGFWLLGL